MIDYPSLVTPSLRHFHPPELLPVTRYPSLVTYFFEQAPANLDDAKVEPRGSP
jgi:hypothetical protein